MYGQLVSLNLGFEIIQFLLDKKRMYYTKHVPSQRNDDLHSDLDSAFLLADVPDVHGEGVDEDDVLGNDKAHYDQTEKVQLETLLDVEECHAQCIQGGRGQARDCGWGRRTAGGRGQNSVEHEGVIISPLNPLIAIDLSRILCSFHADSINLSRY